MTSRVWIVVCLSWFALGCGDSEAPADAPPPADELTSVFDPQAAFDSRCAHCHDGSVAKAPHLIEFQVMGPKAIQATMQDGMMAIHAAGLDEGEIAALASHLGGAVQAEVPVLRCDSNKLPPATPATQGWSLTEEGTRFIAADVAQLAAEQVPQLTLKWVFAYPGATRARSQPVPFGDAILVGSQDGTVYALDMASGCAHWTYSADVEVRSAVALNQDGPRAYFGDIKGTVYAIDPRSGAELWRALANDHPDTTLTGSPRLYRDKLYVPLSSTEWASAADPGYAC